jgi:energy-coupling factor transport system ATP-binding protein
MLAGRVLQESVVKSFIEVRGLEHAYPLAGGGQVAALQGIDLTIERGEFVALIGPNGSGKSTLIRHFNGLLLPTAGGVWVDGLLTSDPRHLWEVRQRVGMVFQNPENQLVASTVEEDVAFGPENMALPPDEIRRRVDEALDVVGMQGYRTHPPQIVFDEPTSMLDPPGRRTILDTVRRLNAEEGITVVLVTQSMEEATIAGRVLVMHAGQIAMDGSPETIFERGERLRALGLGLPSAVEVARRLRDQGVTLPPGLLTIEALAGALWDKVPPCADAVGD